MPSFWDKLKAFDAHGRLNDDYRLKTTSGAACKPHELMLKASRGVHLDRSVCLCTIACWLDVHLATHLVHVRRKSTMPRVLSAFRYLWPAQEKVETMGVDNLQDARLRINFDVTFPS